MKLLSKNENKSYRTKKDRLFSERKNIIANGSKKLKLLLHELLLQKQTNCFKKIFISYMNPIPGGGGGGSTKPLLRRGGGGGEVPLNAQIWFLHKKLPCQALVANFLWWCQQTWPIFLRILCPQSKKTISIQETIQKRKLCHFLTYLRNNNKKCWRKWLRVKS